MAAKDDFLLETMLDMGLTTHDAVEEVRPEAESSGEGVVNTLVKTGRLEASLVVMAKSTYFGVEMVTLSEIRLTDEVINAVPRHVARKYNAVPIAEHEGTVVVALSDPSDIEAIDGLQVSLGKTLEYRVTSEEDLKAALDKYYGSSSSGGRGDSDIARMIQDITEGEVEVSALKGDVKADGEAVDADAPIIRLVNQIIIDAFKLRASDIHLEPMGKRFRLRYRIDGMMTEMKDIPKRLQAPVIARLKISAAMNIAEKRIPQDGRIQTNVGGKVIDLRVSVIPCSHGESIVMRILDKSGLRLGLAELGFMADDQANFERMIALPDGILLVTGPTGSGKTTTLYSCLHYINRPDRKIITVEDPVEYQMGGINQVQVKRDVGMTFAAALRAMLRQAPNIIMIGEIRDFETAEISINAALTGHMVFSTLHTNDSVSAVTRLVDIGVKPFLVSAALRGALAQRLVRRVCQSCAQPYKPTAKELYTIGMTEQDIAGATPMKGAGCAKCGERGYKGRRGVFELLVITEEIQEMIYAGANLVDLRRKAREAGMRTMREDGQRKVASGMTTIEEVMGATVADDVI